MWAFTQPKGTRAAHVSTLLLPLLLAVAAWSQQPDSNLVGDMSEKVLRSYRIKLTEQGVTAALGSDNAAVRKYASRVFSNRWPKNAASPIKVAMLREGDELLRVSLATDLAGLGDESGREMLRTECHNTGEWGTTRMYAARSMTDLHDDFCEDSVLEILRLPSDPQDTNAKRDALDLVLSIIHNSGGQEYRNILDLTMNALNDPDSGVRLTASITLGRLRDTSAIAALEAAVTAEQEATVQSLMLEDLKRLKALHPGQK